MDMCYGYYGSALDSLDKGPNFFYECDSRRGWIDPFITALHIIATNERTTDAAASPAPPPPRHVLNKCEEHQ